ncbi:14494_t:CDS:2 [Funneliformis caledonium]|uniref:14494_t:CDS:1 n=1 Tax=Funneliformis caledonium TaxID=1117310 RepID=A0A9N9CAD5_9GLOM|nr:14494_t:CDS:2 [Funneliformis caledonium]
MSRSSFQEILPFVIDNEEFEESISLQVTSHGSNLENYSPEEETDERSNSGDLAPLLSNASREFDSTTPGESNSVLVLDNGDTLRMPKDGGSFFESFLNMANSIIGAGLPFSFRESGIFAGIILLLGLTYLVDWTIRLLVYNAKLSGRNSYQEVMQFCFGKSGLIIISAFQLLFAFGGDTLPHVITSLFPNISNIPVLNLFTDRYFVIIFCTIFISYPLSLYRDISKLAKASGLALISMVIIVVAVVIEAPRVDPRYKGGDKGTWDFVHPEMFQAIGVISFAFVCHHNSLLIFDSLRKPTLKRFAAVTHLSTGISMLACLLVAIVGYLAFTDKTEGNILNNFPEDNVIINIARFCFGFNMFTTLPLEAFVCRESIEIYYFPNASFSLKRHVILTTIFVMGAMMVSLLTNDLGIVLELTGGCSATALAYILPPACYLKLSSGNWWSRKKLPAVICVGFGIAVMILSTVLTLNKMIETKI